jgi:predicted acetyltransferase
MDTLDATRESDEQRLLRMYRLSFAVEDAATTWWLDMAGRHNVRVLREDGRVAGSMLNLPQGHAVGGRWVRSHGVAGVVVAPEDRGRGVARRMIGAYLRELRDQGVTLSSLFASTRGLYRSVGYEDSGLTFRYTMNLRAADRRGVLPLRPVTDTTEVRRVWRERAVHWHGVLDRGDYVWHRIFERKGHEALAVHGPSGIEGWVVVKLTSGADHWVTLQVADLVAFTCDAADTLLAFLGGYGSIGTHAVFLGGPSHPVLDRMRERRWTTTVHEPWLASIVDLPGALVQRGWRGHDGVLDLEVTDDLLPDNAGRWRLTVSSGQATVEPGGTGALRIDARGLAPLYFGHVSARGLVTRGRASGDDATLRQADRLFRETQPWVGHLF